ncbi:MAG: hydroxymethylpyrimidine kinase/phosphomethylpyrimidine kinase/thiamine-phosphate diphosphorylase [Phenylobacterium sp.]|jgi:hydroxymethylpyrimidine kinase/phosphomethylpyrimidine kinase/thiamine-phosphate diphosphorylase
MVKPIVWTIAGSDCGGGAGIQADIQAISGLGGYACSVITANTAQNSQEVTMLNPVSDVVLGSQLDALAQDMPATVIKIGLLANQAQVRLVADKIHQYKDTWAHTPLVVYDPVAISSTGQLLTEQSTVETVKEKLFPLVDILTPNTLEVQKLTGIYLMGAEAVKQAAFKLMTMGVGSVIIKGGHWNYPAGYCVDYCCTQIGSHTQHYWLASKTVKTPHTHGTGCTFSSAVATMLAQGYPIRDAFTVAKAYINQGLKASFRVGEGIGPVSHQGWPEKLEDFPQVVEIGSTIAEALELNVDNRPSLTSAFTPCRDNKRSLYPVVDSVQWIERLLKLGVKTLQLRLKLGLKSDTEALIESQVESQIIAAVKLGKEYKARVFINDHWALAIKHGAYGVHLGQTDLDKADLNAIKTAGLRLGLSTHGYYEMLRAHWYRPSYLAFGAIYPTKTKDMAGLIQGVDRLKKYVTLFADTPTVAIGGISLKRAAEVAQTGVGSIAVVTAITEAEDVEATVAQFQQLLLDSDSKE